MAETSSLVFQALIGLGVLALAIFLLYTIPAYVFTIVFIVVYILFLLYLFQQQG